MGALGTDAAADGFGTGIARAPPLHATTSAAVASTCASRDLFIIVQRGRSRRNSLQWSASLEASDGEEAAPASRGFGDPASRGFGDPASRGFGGERLAASIGCGGAASMGGAASLLATPPSFSAPPSDAQPLGSQVKLNWFTPQKSGSLTQAPPP
jgi:hypothetical protein